MKRIMLLLNLSCLLSIASYSQWQLFNPLPTEKNLYGVCFSDSLHGWAVGDEGIILKSNGTEWEVIDSPTTEKLLYVFFSEQ